MTEEWIHARVPPKYQGAYEELLKKHKKTEIAMAGFLYLCRREKIAVPA